MHVHEFVDKEDLVTALLASCHLPLVMDGRYASTRSQRAGYTLDMYLCMSLGGEMREGVGVGTGDRHCDGFQKGGWSSWSVQVVLHLAWYVVCGRLDRCTQTRTREHATTLAGKRHALVLII